MILDAASIRKRSMSKAKCLGYATNAHLPLLEQLEMRPATRVFARMFCLEVVIAVAYGHPRSRGERWLVQEQLTPHLSRKEKRFLRGRGDALEMQHQVEALWTFAWAVGTAAELNFGTACPDTLIRLLPDLKVDQPTAEFRRRWHLRAHQEVVQQLDLAYCLHWAIRDAMLNGRKLPGKLHPVYVIERRRALEWLMSDQDWDAVALDT